MLRVDVVSIQYALAIVHSTAATNAYTDAMQLL
jgi:hypothetical protein